MDLVDVIQARHLGGHRLWLRFEDGLEGAVDLRRDLRGPVFEPLRDPAFFAQFHVDLGTVNWPNGADFAPEFLYERLMRARKSRGARRTASKARRSAKRPAAARR